MILCVPALDPDNLAESDWPTLGPLVCAWIEKHLVFGPGDMLGQPYRLSGMKRAYIYRLYQIYPKGHLRAGRRRFKRAALSLRKGRAKTEFAACIAAAELAENAPVRFWKWDAMDRPLGRSVDDPYIPMVAYTAVQSEELAYGALLAILERSRIAKHFDIGLERIMRKRGMGKALPLASAPSARDGARTTFQHFDETHHFRLPGHKRAHRTMLMNIPKRAAADAWSFETTTAPAPGSATVAEETMDYARSIERGEKKATDFFFFHEGAADELDITKPDELRQAVVEASGEDVAWSDIDSIVTQFGETGADIAMLERYWLNRMRQAGEKAFDIVQWRTLKSDFVCAPGRLIVIGFDGARYRDSTALVATDVETGFQWILGIWERPRDLKPKDPWEVPESEVDQCLRDAMTRWQVFRVYADPPYWETTVDKWAGEFGAEVVVKWPTIRYNKVAHAVRAYSTSQAAAEVGHNGDPVLERHIANAHRQEISALDDQGTRMYVIRKERPDSPDKMDGAMAALLSWEARGDAIALGAKPSPKTSFKVRILQ